MVAFSRVYHIHEGASEVMENAIYQLSVHDDMLIICMMHDAAGRNVWYVSRKDDHAYVSQSNFSAADAIGRFVIHGQKAKREGKNTSA